MANHDDTRTSNISDKEHSSNSSSSSNGTNSTPHTPPSPPAVELYTPPIVVVTPPRNVRHTAGKSPRTPTSKSRLGKIDENSDAITPDIPDRNPLRRFGDYTKKFYIPNIPTLHATHKNPRNIYDDVEGPRGEKFSDVRRNKKTGAAYHTRTPPQKQFLRWKIWACMGLVLAVLTALAIGLGIGLTIRNRNRNTNADSNADTTSSGVNGPAPAGQYTITAYLDAVNTSCTANSATWLCYPYQTYSQSPSTSLSTLNWIIAAQSGDAYTISSADTVFSYTFQNVALQKKNNGSADESWEFQTTFDKLVIPSTTITTDGSNARCFFNNTVLLGVLYTKKPKVQALQNATASTGGNTNKFQPWPNALYFSESHSNGAGVPNCYKYANGQLGERIPVNEVVTSEGTVANCQCHYTNFFP